jgi:N-acyl-phosphatidylethanolamine-hydrolysing phospholipase D
MSYLMNKKFYLRLVLSIFFISIISLVFSYSVQHSGKNTFKNIYSSSLTQLSLDFINWLAFEPRPKGVALDIKPFDTNKYKLNATSITWIGHSTFLIKLPRLTVLTDPHLTQRASPISFIGPKRYTPPALSIKTLPLVDVVIISHDHYDHLDMKTITLLHSHQPNILYIVPLRIGKILTQHGITNWSELDWWKSLSIGQYKFTAVPAEHFSGRGLVRNNTLWASWIIETFNSNDDIAHTIFFGGDTGYSAHFKDIYQRFKSIDLSLLPIGAYSPRRFMKAVHMTPEEAVQAHIDLNSKRSIGMHWGSFILTDEPILEPIQRLKKNIKQHGITDQQFMVMQPGETLWHLIP